MSLTDEMSQLKAWGSALEEAQSIEAVRAVETAVERFIERRGLERGTPLYDDEAKRLQPELLAIRDQASAVLGRLGLPPARIERVGSDLVSR